MSDFKWYPYPATEPPCMGNYLVSSDDEVFVSSVEEVCGELFFEAEDEGALDGKINKGSYIKAWAYIPTLDSPFWTLTQKPIDYGEYVVLTKCGAATDEYLRSEYDDEVDDWDGVLINDVVAWALLPKPYKEPRGIVWHSYPEHRPPRNGTYLTSTLSGYVDYDSYSRGCFGEEHLATNDPTVAWTEIPPIDDLEFWHRGNDPRLIGKYLVYAFSFFEKKYAPATKDYSQCNLNDYGHGFKETDEDFVEEIFAWAYLPRAYKAPKKSAPTGSTAEAVMNHFERGD